MWYESHNIRKVAEETDFTDRAQPTKSKNPKFSYHDADRCEEDFSECLSSAEKTDSADLAVLFDSTPIPSAVLDRLTTVYRKPGKADDFQSQMESIKILDETGIFEVCMIADFYQKGGR